MHWLIAMVITNIFHSVAIVINLKRIIVSPINPLMALKSELYIMFVYTMQLPKYVAKITRCSYYLIRELFTN